MFSSVWDFHINKWFLDRCLESRLITETDQCEFALYAKPKGQTFAFRKLVRFKEGSRERHIQSVHPRFISSLSADRTIDP